MLISISRLNTQTGRQVRMTLLFCCLMDRNNILHILLKSLVRLQVLAHILVEKRISPQDNKKPEDSSGHPTLKKLLFLLLFLL